MNTLTVGGETGSVRKVIYELKYPHGYRYLDACGSIINAIQKESEEWVLASDANPQGGSLISLANGALLNFSAQKIDISLENPVGAGQLSEEDISVFKAQVKIVPEIIVDMLGVNTFSRMGFRAAYMFPMESMEQSEAWLLNMGAYAFSTKLIEAFGGKIEATNALIVIFGTSAKYRIAFNGVERQAQLDFGQGLLNIQARTLPKGQREHLRRQLEIKKRMRQNPEFAVVIDIDCSVDDPKETDAVRFINECVAEYSAKIQASIGTGGV